MLQSLTRGKKLRRPRFAENRSIDGVVTPFVINHFRGGIQTSRINYEKVDYNQPLADSLFAKPANLKAIK